MTQNLPIGSVTSPHAVRVRRRRIRWAPRIRAHVALAAAGLAAAAAGLLLYAAPHPVAVSMSPEAYAVGGARLTATAPGVYRGPAGASIVLVQDGSTTRAGASAVLDGEPTTGSCVLPAGAKTETCLFTVAGRELTATDRWHTGGWSRTYSDGREIEIQVAGGHPVPVPLPVGR